VWSTQVQHRCCSHCCSCACVSARSLLGPLQAALTEQGISTPTEIQAAAVPALLRHRSTDFVLASHTGSGKTLAYLLPVGEERALLLGGWKTHFKYCRCWYVSLRDAGLPAACR